jgi:uncharacterized membrane protein YdjX (TVP38/TMEM64 family)
MVLTLFTKFTEWVKVHPLQSIGYSCGFLTFSVMFMIPISYTIVMLGYTYTTAYNSKLYGFLFSVPIVYLGCLLGAFFAFFVSRYLF